MNRQTDNTYIGTDGIIELFQKWFYSIQLPSPLYFLIVNIISWNLLVYSQIEVVFLFNTYMISPHYRLFPYSSQHQYKKIFTNFTSQNNSHSDIFRVSKYTKPLIYLLMIGTRRHVHKLYFWIGSTFYS